MVESGIIILRKSLLHMRMACMLDILKMKQLIGSNRKTRFWCTEVGHEVVVGYCTILHCNIKYSIFQMSSKDFQMRFLSRDPLFWSVSFQRFKKHQMKLCHRLLHFFFCWACQDVQTAQSHGVYTFLANQCMTLSTREYIAFNPDWSFGLYFNCVWLLLVILCLWIWLHVI